MPALLSVIVPGGIMSWLSYAFEAKSIQSYILAGGRLRHIVGGSAIVDALSSPEDFGGESALADHLVAAAIPEVNFLRCAGGAFAFVIEETDATRRGLDCFRSLWTLHVQRVAPGLSFVDAIGRGCDVAAAQRSARNRLEGRRSLPTHTLPIASPLVLRAPRTGGAVVGAAGDDLLDENLAAKEAVVDLMRETRHSAVRRDRLADAFLPSSVRDGAPLLWPTDMETEFPFLGEDRTVAVLHADGNRMGELVIALGRHLEAAATTRSDPSAFAERYLRFSLAADTATRRAAATAGAVIARAAETRPAGDPKKRRFYPARPIVLAGDDVTVILRPDIAVEFTVTFLAAFAEEARELVAPELADIRMRSDDGIDRALPELTACAGLAFCGADQPFLQVQDLAESLCRHAKARAKEHAPQRWQTVPTCFSFHRLSGSHIAEYSELLANDLTTKDGTGRLLTAQPYRVGARESGDAMPHVDDLSDAVDLLVSGEVKAGGLRELAGHLYRRPAQAAEDFARMGEVMERRSDVEAVSWKKFGTAIRKMLTSGGEIEGATPLFHAGRTPLLDVISLAQILRRQGVNTFRRSGE